MTALATIIIPIAPQHAAIAARAIASANAQTVPVVVLPIVDDTLRGAGFARNRGIELAETEFLAFLDADDLLMPNFVERCYAVYQQTGRYVYTDFLDDSGARHPAPDCAFTYHPGDFIYTDPMATAHAVTTLVPTDWARRVDGFDEDLPGGEDSEFFIHLGTEGLCGTRLPEALFVYANAPNGRSKRFRANGIQQYEALIQERYTDKGKTMGCCSEPAKPKPELDRAAPGVVLARPRWGGNRQERGNVTGFLYPRVDKFSLIEVDPRDAAARPDLWEIVARPQSVQVQAPLAPQPWVTPPTPDLKTLGQHALQIKPPPAQPPAAQPPAPVAQVAPDVGRVTRLAQRITAPKGEWRGDPGAEYLVPPAALATEQALKELTYVSANVRPHITTRTGDPVFVFPDKDYPSYTDVRRLVELSGFPMSHPHVFPNGQRYIWLSPEQPPDYMQFGSNHIWWSLEYGGEYEPDLTNWRGEVWASDPAWAKAHGAKMVVMGSHPDLCGVLDTGATLYDNFAEINGALAGNKKYDAVMLAYMTPRRERIHQQLADLAWPQEPYPGYGVARHLQLAQSRLMLHVHQRDDTAAIAPQRLALAAAYKLPLVCEYVADAGEYARTVPFVRYDNLNGEVRSQLAMMGEGIPQARAERLYQWLCIENTFRRCVEAALKG